MANYFYMNQSKNNLSEFIGELARLLNNHLGAHTGPGWTIIDTYSSATALHEVPSDPTDIDTLSAANAWRAGGIALTDYIIMQSVGTDTKCQVGLEYQNSYTLRVIISYEDSFDVNNNNADMTNAANWTKKYITYVDWTLASSIATYSIVASEDYFIILKTTVTHRVCWAGLLNNSSQPEGTIAIRFNNVAYLRDNASLWYVLSHAATDDVFANVSATEGGLNLSSTEVFSTSTNYVTDTASGNSSAMSVVISSQYETHGIAGGLYWLRRGFGGGSPSVGNFNSYDYAFVDGHASYAPAGIDWDGSTALT